MPTKTDLRITALIILIHTLLLAVGSQVLAITFEFPDVLREPAAYRLGLFTEHSGVIIPAYYLMALSGLTQLTIAVLLYRCHQQRDSTLLLMAAVFGVLSGAWQVMGFLRWSILIPYLAGAMQAAQASGGDTATVALLEGFANRYIGMAVGEHLGFVGEMVWTILLALAMLQRTLFEKRLAWIGLALGILHFPFTMEPLGGPFAPFAEWSLFVITGWIVWLLLLGWSLARTDPTTGAGPRLGWPSYTAAFVLYLMFVLPALGG